MLNYIAATSENLNFIGSYSEVLLLVAALVFVKALVGVLMRWMGIRTIAQQRSYLEVDPQYYYHAGVSMLMVSTTFWSSGDISIWLVSFVIPGILRNVVRLIAGNQDFQLQLLRESHKQIPLLRISKRFSLLILLLSLSYITFALTFFRHSNTPVLGILLYPTWRLLVDAAWLLRRTLCIQRNLLYYHNNNIGCEPPNTSEDFYHSLISLTIKTAHYCYMLNRIHRYGIALIDLIYSPWIIAVAIQIVSSIKEILQLMINHYYLLQVVERVNNQTIEVSCQPHQMCPICQQELVVGRQLHNCIHRFHLKCIYQWVNFKRQPLCPVCRTLALRKEPCYGCSKSKSY